MAGLNLIPNPSVLGVQIGLFLATMVVIKNLFLKPYLKVREARDKATVGNQADAVQILVKNEKDLEFISQRMIEASTKTKTILNDIRGEAVKQKDEILLQADTETKTQLAAIRKEIDTELNAEKKKLPEVVNRLSEQFYNQVLQ